MVCNDDFDKEIYDFFKNNNQVPEEITRTIYQVNLKNNHTIKAYRLKRIIATIVSVLTISVGIVFAKDIERIIKERFLRGNGVETAVENGYMEKVEEDYTYKTVSIEKGEKVVDSIDVGIKLKDFIATENNLSIEFEMTFDNKIKQYKDFSANKINGNINYEYFGHIVLENMYIVGDENIYIDEAQDESGITYVTEIDDTTNTILVVHQLTGSGITEAKHFDIKFSKISFVPKESVPNEFGKIDLIGDWEFAIDIPEYMRNDKPIYYNVTECNDDNFEVYEAKATSTGFELGIMISNIEEPVKNPELVKKEAELMNQVYPKGMDGWSTKEEFIKIYGEEKYVQMYKDWEERYSPIDLTGYHIFDEFTDGTYVQNSRGEKFTHSGLDLSRNKSYKWEEGNKYNFYETFDMTKFNATNEIKIVLDHDGKMVEIYLKQKD